MGNVTYEQQDISDKLETFEWDYVWHEHTEDMETKRVLYIGDSISFGTFPQANVIAEGQILFDNFASSKALDNPYLFPAIELFVKQMNRCDCVLFNNGLHGWHLEDCTEYKRYYEQMVQCIEKLLPNAKLYLITSTCVQDSERNERVIARNRCVSELAVKKNLPVIDLYASSEEHTDLRTDDGVHYTIEGYRKFAEAILKNL